jgi:GT2 family glycosyltransferase
MGHNGPVTWGRADGLVHSVSVVVPTRGREARLRRAVEAVVDDAAVAEVVVVVDGEAAAGLTPSFLRELQANGRVRTVSGPGRGVSEARALGVAAASGDVVLFLDDDVVAEPGLPSGHLAHHARRAGLVVVGSMPVADELLARSATARAYESDYERVCRSYEASNDAVLLDLWGGNVSMRRDECRRIGVASTAFPFGQHEDRDFGLRCRAAGLMGVFDPALVATHHYMRAPRDFLRLARDQVVATQALHALHRDVLGPWAPDQYRRGVSRRLRWVVGPSAPANDSAAGGGAALTALRILRRAAHVAHARRVEDRALTLSRAVVQHTTAQRLVSDHADSTDPGDGGDGRGQLNASDAIPAIIITNPSTT